MWFWGFYTLVFFPFIQLYIWNILVTINSVHNFGYQIKWNQHDRTGIRTFDTEDVMTAQTCDSLYHDGDGNVNEDDDNDIR